MTHTCNTCFDWLSLNLLPKYRANRTTDLIDGTYQCFSLLFIRYLTKSSKFWFRDSQYRRNGDHILVSRIVLFPFCSLQGHYLNLTMCTYPWKAHILPLQNLGAEVNTSVSTCVAVTKRHETILFLPAYLIVLFCCQKCFVQGQAVI